MSDNYQEKQNEISIFSTCFMIMLAVIATVSAILVIFGLSAGVIWLDYPYKDAIQELLPPELTNLANLLPAAVAWFLGGAGFLLITISANWLSKEFAHSIGLGQQNKKAAAANDDGGGGEITISALIVDFLQMFVYPLLYYAALAIMLVVLIRSFPQTPDTFITVLLAGIGVGMPPLYRWLRKRSGRFIDKPIDATVKKTTFFERLKNDLPIIAMIAAFGLFFYWVYTFDNKMMRLLVTFATTTGVAILILFGFFKIPRWAKRPILKGDYDTALHRIDLLKRWGLGILVPPPSGAVLLLWAGRFQEAETALQEDLAEHYRRSDADHQQENSLLKKMDTPMTGLAEARLLTYLGYALMEQERYKEATERFRKADQCYPQSGAAVGLAEVYLRQQLEPEQALALLDRLATDTPEFTEGATRGEYWVNRAWALALLAQPAEAEVSLKRALLHLNELPKPHQAGLLYRAGLVARLLDNRQTADQHFRQAAQLDPHGNFGQRAAKALRGFES